MRHEAASRGTAEAPRPPALLSSPALGFFLAALERRGLAVRPLLARWKIDRASPAFPVHEIERFTEDCAALARDPLFGLHVALELPRGAWGAAEFVWRSAPTFGDAIAALQDLAPTVSELLQPRVERVGSRLRLAYPLPLGAPPIGRHGNEFILGVASRMLRELSGERQRPLRIGLAHARPVEAPAVSELLGAPLLFDQPQCWIELSPAIASTPIATADPALFKALRDLLEPLKLARSKPRSFVAQVAQAIEERLVGGSLAAAELGRALKISPRSLQRRLQQEGTHLSALIDEVRRRRAGALLADPAIPLDDVAYRLGFSQLSAFARAYRRWTGKSPGAAREALLGGGEG